MGAGWLVDISRGEWWLPDAPHKRVPGVLVERNGRYRLELIGAFGAGEFANDVRRYSVVCGFLASGGPVTLISCVGSMSLSVPGMITEDCSFRIAVKGHNFDTVGDVFQSVSGHCPALLTWMNRSGLEVMLKFPNEGEMAPSFEWNAAYRIPETLIFNWSESVRFAVRIAVAGLPTGAAATKPIRIEQICVVEATSTTPTTISSLQQALNGFELLVRLLSGFPRSLQITKCISPHATNDDGRATVLEFQIDSSSIDYLDVENLDWREAWVPYSTVEENLPVLVPRWREILGRQGEVIYSYFAGRRAKHIEDQLVTCANTLQRLDESVRGRRKFESAVSDAIHEYLPTDLATESVALLARTRHYFTHYNPDESDGAARGAQLANLVDLVDAIVTCKLLELLGFSVAESVAEVKGFLDSNHEFGKRLSMSRWRDS